MSRSLVLVSLSMALSLLSAGGAPSAIQNDFPSTWVHGSEDCGENGDPPVQVHRYTDSTWILRQNKCIHYEAPFIYLLLGDNSALMQDTGAVASSDGIRNAVDEIIGSWQAARGGGAIELIVSHSHSHGDHVAGDPQFGDRENTTIIGHDVGSVREAFGISDWPAEAAELDLGGRILDIIPVPGHQESHVAIYDRQSRVLLTGDTLYTGRLYVWDWPAYRASISRLVEFTRSRPVSYVLGTHIEMSGRPGIDYPVGTRYQPDEHPLQLRLSHLIELHQAVLAMGDEPKAEVHDSFIIVPRQ